MGLPGKTVLFMLGTGSLAFHLWPLSIVCFGVLAYVLRPKKPDRPKQASKRQTHYRTFLAAFLLLLAAIAAVTGGPYPVFVLLFVLAVLPWAVIFNGLTSSRLDPVGGSVLMRSVLLPFYWHVLAEVKSGCGSLPRALSSYQGRLIFTRSGSAFVHVRAFGLKAEAENKAMDGLRQAAKCLVSDGAYLMPLDSGMAARVLSQRLKRIRSIQCEFPDLGADVLVTESREGFLVKAGAFREVGTSSLPSVPRTFRLRDRPLLWETLERAAKSRKLPEPDSFSNLLESFAASKGEPIGERLGALKDAGEMVTVQSLSGEWLNLTRPQLRALASVYS